MVCDTCNDAPRDPVYIALSTPYHVRGWVSDPKLYIYIRPPPTADVNVSIVLADTYGNIVTDVLTTRYPAGAQQRVIDLGDYLNTQRRLKNLGIGVYVLFVYLPNNEVVITPIFLSDAVMTRPSEDLDKLKYVSILDKVTGFHVKLPPVVESYPADFRYDVYFYYHDDDNRLGRLVLYRGGIKEWDTGYTKEALIRTEFKFNSAGDLLLGMMRRVFGVPPNVLNTILNEYSAGRSMDAIRLLKPFYMATAYTLGDVTIDIEADPSTKTYKIVERTYVRLGFLPGLDAVIKYFTVVAGCIAGAFATHKVILAATSVKPPLAAVAAVAIGAGCLAYGVYHLYMEAQSNVGGGLREVMHDLEQKEKEQKEKLSGAVDDAKQIVDQLLKQGKITKDDYDMLMNALTKIEKIGHSAIDDMYESAIKAYDSGYKAGYNAGVSDSYKWIAVAGVGGLVTGVLISRK